MLGKGIKYYRKQKAITQKELAEMCGISNNSMCSIESNITMANKTSIVQICKHLDVSIEQLMYKSIPDNILKKLIYDDTNRN
jgi:DNA-binding XRE family transcriptional regulator